MAHVSTVQVNNQVYTYDQLQTMMANGTLDVNSIKDVSVFNQSNDQAAVKDGKDDGKVGFFEGLGSVLKGAVKGVVNGIKGMFTDENGKFSLGKTLKSAAMIGACFIPGVGPVVAAGMCAYGAVKGGVGLAKGISAAANATTDAEKHAALESCGANGVAVAASVAGLKGSVSQIARNAGVSGAATNGIAKNIAKTAGKVKGSYVNATKIHGGTATAGVKAAANKLTGNYYRGLGWQDAISKGVYGTGKNISTTASAIANHTPKVVKGIAKGGEKLVKGTGKAVTAPIKKAGSNFVPKSIKNGYNSAKATVQTKANTFANNVHNASGKYGLNTKTALKVGVASGITDEAEKMTNNIANTYTTYANATIQTGREFDLEDYQVYSF